MRYICSCTFEYACAPGANGMCGWEGRKPRAGTAMSSRSACTFLSPKRQTQILAPPTQAPPASKLSSQHIPGPPGSAAIVLTMPWPWLVRVVSLDEVESRVGLGSSFKAHWQGLETGMIYLGILERDITHQDPSPFRTICCEDPRVEAETRLEGGHAPQAHLPHAK